MEAETPELLADSARQPCRVPKKTAPHVPQLRLFLPSLLSAGLLFLCFFPADQGWLVWVALVPLLGLTRSSAKPLWVFLSSWICGLVFFLTILQWMRYADPRMYYAWVGLAVSVSFYFPLSIFLMRRLDRFGLPLTVSAPIAWTAGEYLRGYWISGFSWYFLAHAQHDSLVLIQIADLAGAHALTMLVAVVNGLLCELLSRQEWFRTFFAIPESKRCSCAAVQIAAVTGLFFATCSYGWYRLDQEDFRVGPRLALIQGNDGQEARNAASEEEDSAQAKKILLQYFTLTDQAWRTEPRPDLVVWPETSYPAVWEELPEGRPSEDSRWIVDDTRKRWQVPVLYGINARIWQPSDPVIAEMLSRGDGPVSVLGALPWSAIYQPMKYNSAVLIVDDGPHSGAARYDKMHRVPFGEYVPLKEWLPWMNYFAPYNFDYSITAGKSFTRFPLKGFHFGVLICVEDTDPHLSRQYMRSNGENEPAVDFLINISNDGWFGGSSEHDQHLVASRFRAVECRRSLARAVNMGITAVIDGSGRVIALPRQTWAESKKVADVVTAAMPIDHRSSLYVRWGDWLPVLCWILIGISMVKRVPSPLAPG